jgi:hypothetical protein
MGWLIGIGLPFFLLGLWLGSWRAPLYAAAIWLGLFALWFGAHVLTGNYNGQAGGGGFDVDLVSERGLLALAWLVVGLSVIASSLGAVTAGFLGRRARTKPETPTER